MDRPPINDPGPAMESQAPMTHKAEVSLWAGVLSIAILDCWDVGPEPQRGQRPTDRAIGVLNWIDDTSDAPGSFRYCCFVLGLDSCAVESYIKSRLNEPFEVRKVLKRQVRHLVNP